MPSSSAAATSAAAGAVWMPNPPCPAHQKNPAPHDRSRRPASGRARSCAGPPSCARPRSTRQSTACSSRSIAMATSSSSGCDVAGIGGDLVVRAEPQPPARFRLEIEVAADVRDVRQRRRARADRCAAATSVRRYGAMPIGATPAIAATGSAHAPAASTSIFAANIPAAGLDPPVAVGAGRAGQRRIEHSSAARLLRAAPAPAACSARRRYRRSSAPTRRAFHSARSPAIRSRGSTRDRSTPVPANSRQQRLDQRRALLAPDVQRAERLQEPARVEQPARCAVSGWMCGPAVGFRPECRRPPGRVIARRLLASSISTLACGATSAARLAPAIPAPMIAISKRSSLAAPAPKEGVDLAERAVADRIDLAQDLVRRFGAESDDAASGMLPATASASCARRPACRRRRRASAAARSSS